MPRLSGWGSPRGGGGHPGCSSGSEAVLTWYRSRKTLSICGISRRHWGASSWTTVPRQGCLRGGMGFRGESSPGGWGPGEDLLRSPAR